MEEKERYGITDAHYLCDSAIFDIETDEILRLYQICDLLNQQDKENQQLKQQLKDYKKRYKKAYKEGLLQKQFDKDMEIEQLKQQLAEKEKNALALFSALYDILEEQDPENVSSRIDYLTKQNNGAISDFYKEHKVLKQQLADKTLTIEQINKAFIENRSLWKGKYEQSNQDKISFAVKQLEKLKKEFNARKLEYITMETKTHIYGLRIDRINELIENQINELKGEK